MVNFAKKSFRQHELHLQRPKGSNPEQTVADRYLLPRPHVTPSHDAIEGRGDLSLVFFQLQRILTLFALFRLSLSRLISNSSASCLYIACSSCSFGMTCASYNFSARLRVRLQHLRFGVPVLNVRFKRATCAAAASRSAEIWRSSSFASSCPLCTMRSRLREKSKPRHPRATRPHPPGSRPQSGPEATNIGVRRAGRAGEAVGIAGGRVGAAAATDASFRLHALQARGQTHQRDWYVSYASFRLTSQTTTTTLTTATTPAAGTSTHPAGAHPVINFPRPCIPERIAPSSLGTSTRAEEKPSDCLAILPSGLQRDWRMKRAARQPFQLHRGVLSGMSSLRSTSSMATSTLACEVSTTSAKVSPAFKLRPTMSSM